VAQAGQAQVVRQARIGSQGRGVGLEVEEVEFLDAQLVLFEHHEGLADVVEAAGDQAARFAAAADQVEILAGGARGGRSGWWSACSGSPCPGAGRSA
jgi:hypothetical protein